MILFSVYILHVQLSGDLVSGKKSNQEAAPRSLTLAFKIRPPPRTNNSHFNFIIINRSCCNISKALTIGKLLSFEPTASEDPPFRGSPCPFGPLVRLLVYCLATFMWKWFSICLHLACTATCYRQVPVKYPPIVSVCGVLIDEVLMYFPSTLVCPINYVFLLFAALFWWCSHVSYHWRPRPL